jgi:hypothetical protein
MITAMLAVLAGRSPAKECLQIWNGVGQNRGMVSPLHGEPERPI